MTTRPLLIPFKACLLTILLVLLQFPASGAQPQEPEQVLDVIHIGLETSSVNVTVTNTSGATAEFPGYISCDSPLMTVDAALSVTSSDWPAYADPSTIHFQGRDNVSFKFIMNVTAGVANGTVGSAHVMIAVLAKGPGRSYANEADAMLTATVTNSDELQGKGPGGKDWSGTYIPITINTTKPGKKDPLLTYTPYIAGIAVIGIIAGVAIKVKARRERSKTSRPDADKST